MGEPKANIRISGKGAKNDSNSFRVFACVFVFPSLYGFEKYCLSLSLYLSSLFARIVPVMVVGLR